MIKTDKVKSVEKWNTPPHETYGYTFNVVMENGDTGLSNAKTETHPYFLVGQEVEYEREEKPKKDGSGTVVRLKKPKPAFGGGGGGGWKPKDAKAYKAESITMCLKYGYEAAEKFADDPSKLNPADIEKWFKAFVGYAHTEIDKLFA